MDEGAKNYSLDHIFAGSNLSVLVDKTKSARDGLKTAHTNLDESEEEEVDKEDTYATSHNVPEDTSVMLALVPETFSLSLLYSSEHKPEPRHTKDFKSKYNKIKAKVALLSLNALAPSSSSGKNKGLSAETYDWDEEEVSFDDNEVTKIKSLMALTDEERVYVGKESANNGE
nr:hypothetical protein [Tanacetum cinerariifolium]